MGVGEPISKSYILYDSIYVTVSKWQMIEMETDLWWLGTSGSGGGARVSVTTKGQLGGIPDDGTILYLVVVVPWIYAWSNCMGLHPQTWGQLKLVKSKLCRLSISWLWYYTIVMWEITIGENWVKGTQGLCTIFAMFYKYLFQNLKFFKITMT